jgi:integrase
MSGGKMSDGIRRRGENSFELKYEAGIDTRTGKRITKYLSFKGSLREAKVKRAELITTVAKGSHIDTTKVTVAEFVRSRIDQWEASGSITARSAARYRELNENQIVPHIGAMALQKLRPLHIEQWHSDLRDKGRADGKGGLAPRTIGHAHRVLSSALSDAAENDLVLRNIMHSKSPPKVPDEEMVIARDVPALVAELKVSSRTLYVPAMVSLFTGMRRNEVLALKWGRVDLDRKVIEVREALEFTKAHGIRFKPPKSKAGRRDITLPDILVETLREYRKAQLELRLRLAAGKLQDDDLLFTDINGAPLSPNAVSAAWSDYAKRIGMAEVTFHALRHTHASQLISEGVDIVTISKRLGHAKPDITLRIYAHLYRKDDGKAAAAINAILK